MAKVELKELEGCRRSLRVEVEPEKVKSVREKVLNDVLKKADIPGFRPGKAPRDLVQNRFREAIDREVAEELISETYRQAVADNKLEPISEPAISEVDSAEDRLNYTAVFDIAPKVEIDSYSGLSLQQKKLDVPEEEVNRVLEEVLKHNPQLQIQARDLKIRDNLKNSLRQRLELQVKSEAEQAEDDRIVEQLLVRAQLSAPESLVKRRTVELVRHALGHEKDFAGKTKEEQEKTVLEMMDKMRPQAEKEVKASFVLSEIAEREKVVISDEDIEKRLEIMARIAGKEKADYAAQWDAEMRADLRSQMRIERTLSLLKRRALLLEKPTIIKA